MRSLFKDEEIAYFGTVIENRKWSVIAQGLKFSFWKGGKGSFLQKEKKNLLR
jgi:hypothetical protein